MSQMAQPPMSAERPAVRSHQSHGSRTFSFRSDKSGGSKGKEDLTESPREKARRDSIWKATSKANPNAAIQENQPGVNAVLEESTLAPLRSVQHRDAYGNVITDPDLSNPTRPRMERPLDTIRSFEKAIDNGYKRKSNYMRTDSDPNMQQQQYDRRSSGYGFDAGHNQNRYANGNGGGYYGGQRTESMVGGPRRYPNNRMGSEQMMYGQRQYPQHAQQQSQDTGSDSTGPWANSTDPSSENSSVDRIAPPVKPYGENGYPPNGYTHNGYGSNGFQGSIPEEGGYPMRGGAPPVQAPERRPIPLGNSGDAPLPTGNLPSTRRPEAEKRKSWLSRRFSKKN